MPCINPLVTTLTLDADHGRMTLIGSGFAFDSQFTLTAPGDVPVALEVVSLTPTEVHFKADLQAGVTYCLTIFNPEPPPVIPPPDPGDPPTPPGGPPPDGGAPPGPPGGGPGGCGGPLTPGFIAGAPAWFEQGLIARGATTCFDMGIFASMEGEANAHSMMPQRGVNCNMRERLHECVLNGAPLCGHPQCGNWGQVTDHNTEHAGFWHWD